MAMQTITLKGEEYVILPRREFNQIVAKNGRGKIPLPPLPEPDKSGNTPAIALARTSIAREIIERMNAAGLSQTQLAQRARIPRETLNRILKCIRTPDEKTVAKIERALSSKSAVSS